MIWIDFLYNLLLAVVDGAALVAMAKQRGWRRSFVAVGSVTLLSLFLALLAGGMFLAARLFAFGLFVHLPVLLLVCGWFNRHARSLQVFSWSLAILLSGIAIDAFFVEPHWLEESHFSLESGDLQQPLRIVIIADLQTDTVGAYEDRVIARVMAQAPDLILLAGDYLQLRDDERFEREKDRLRALFTSHAFQAPYGIFAVAGNTDHHRWSEIFAGLPVHVFHATETIERDRFSITGLSMPDSFDTAADIAATDKFHIVLGHSPDFALGNVAADLLVAGHVHGGQVRLPGIGPLMTLSRIPRAWTVGLTEVGNNRHLIVSRGVGMERGSAPRLRFLCRPEIVIVDINPAP